MEVVLILTLVFKGNLAGSFLSLFFEVTLQIVFLRVEVVVDSTM